MSQSSNSNTNSTNYTKTIKFLYNYGGKIAPRTTNGKLRYVGGYTRVLFVNRSTTFADLMVKFGECCGMSMNLKCKLPSEDLDVLVSIKSNEDIKNVTDEYRRVSLGTKIKALLFPMKSKKNSPTSPVSSFDFLSALMKLRKAVPATALSYFGPPPHFYEKRSPRQHLYHVPHWN